MTIRTTIAVVSLGLAMSSTGCARYTQSKVDLVDQARHGVALVRDAMTARRSTLDAFTQRQHAQLDAAFDADVRTNATSLTAGWVIDARKAYTIGLDALAEQNAQFDTADAAATSNLDAIDRSLMQLQQMQMTELQFTLPEVTR